MSETSQGDIKEGTCHSLNVPDTDICNNLNDIQKFNVSSDSLKEEVNNDRVSDGDSQREQGNAPNFPETPFSKVNHALFQLKTEMVFF